VKGFNPEKNFADKLRLKLSEKADAVLFYWEKGKKEIESFTKNSGHFFVAPNTLDTDRQFSLKYKFDETGIENLKKELKVNEKFHFIYTGRLLKDKQVDLLLKAFKKLEEINPDCRLSIIGNGSEYNYLKKLSEDLKAVNIYFLGEILDEETAGKWIYISDAYVMPGRLGLSVVHSFCFGTPVISQKKNSHYHGEGIGYIKEGVNGFLASDGNVNEITEIMNRIISDKELSEKLKHNAFETAKNDCSVDKMLDGFDSAINYVMKN
jgi:glycosyltransferase involved in cell wall biosynthesis